MGRDEDFIYLFIATYLPIQTTYLAIYLPTDLIYLYLAGIWTCALYVLQHFTTELPASIPFSDRCISHVSDYLALQVQSLIYCDRI